MILLLLVALLASPALAADAPHLILISMDTTRADALSCYGQVPGLQRPRGQVTPYLDALAEEGARFERFHAHAPTTLNSHASMLTGRDPHGHAVPRNGYPLPEGIDTLATRLSAAGWDTVAVIGAAALESAMGLDRGFRVYDDALPVKMGPQYQDRAAGVVDRALGRVDARDGGEPLFLFVHFFDPHQPYAPPASWRARFADPGYEGPWATRAGALGKLRAALVQGEADPDDVDQINALYLAEVAYMDAQIGRLLDGLRARGLLDHAVLAVVADHGEVLSEVPRFAWTHGADVTDGVMRVPLIVRGYGVPLAEHAVVRRQAEMAGLAPTLEEALGLEPTLGHHASFYDLIRPGPVRDTDGWPERPTRPVVLEATRPHHLEQPPRWNNLSLRRGIRAGGQVLRVPIGGSGDRPAFEGPPSLRSVLAGQIDRWDALAPPFRDEELSAETRAALEALGYLETE